jgi:hypothetical protein
MRISCTRPQYGRGGPIVRKLPNRRTLDRIVSCSRLLVICRGERIALSAAPGRFRKDISPNATVWYRLEASDGSVIQGSGDFCNAFLVAQVVNQTIVAFFCPPKRGPATFYAPYWTIPKNVSLVSVLPVMLHCRLDLLGKEGRDNGRFADLHHLALTGVSTGRVASQPRC